MDIFFHGIFFLILLISFVLLILFFQFDLPLFFVQNTRTCSNNIWIYYNQLKKGRNYNNNTKTNMTEKQFEIKKNVHIQCIPKYTSLPHNLSRVRGNNTLVQKDEEMVKSLPKTPGFSYRFWLRKAETSFLKFSKVCDVITICRDKLLA